MQHTTADGVTVRIAGAGPDPDLLGAAPDGAVETGPTGVPALEPLVAVTRDGETALHARCSPAEMESIAAKPNDPTAGDPDAVVEHAPDPATLPATGSGLPGLDLGSRVVLGACGWRRPTATEDHEAAGGFLDPDPAAVLDAGADLLGRGWGDLCQDAPLAGVWETARDADGDAAVVLNAHGDAADRLLLESAPFEALDGAAAVAGTVDADRIVVYASTADERTLATAREAAREYPDPPAPIDVVAGPAEYRAAEPTMAIEAIEGNHRLEARISPPGPESVGLFEAPTVVHTARTTAHLAAALRADDGDAGTTRTVTVTGDVEAPATVELAPGATVEDALAAVTVDGTFKAACVGGRFGGVTRDLDVGVDPGALADADLGTEGTVAVLADDRCVLEFVGRRTQFAADENCGRCVPCREGTVQLAELLRDVYDGDYDPAGIEELVGVMERTSVCEFGVAAGRPARTAIDAFESELLAHADGRCPADSCLDAPEAT